MGKIHLLDCTLRDGGYVNNWEFGVDCIREFPHRLAKANIDIMELGFIRNETYNPERTVFTSKEDLKKLEKMSGGSSTIYSAMIVCGEKGNEYPIHKLGIPEETGIDLIRVCTWRRLMEEHIEYCDNVGKLGYKVSIQPTAIDQYNDEEFIRLLRLSNEIHPFALYLVDTWGTQSASQICHYAALADKYLDKETKLGYHGHNNKMQALNCVDAILKMGLDRDICIDSSVMGMGRGPGNLQTEVAMDYLNNNYDGKYDVKTAIGLGSSYIKKFYDRSPWGYSIYHFISSRNSMSQDFATYFKEQGYSIERFIAFIDTLSSSERVVFKRDFVENRLKEMNI